MIDQDIRDIVESELRTDEIILWAEKVSSKKIANHILDLSQDEKVSRRFGLPIGLIVHGTMAVLCFPQFKFGSLLFVMACIFIIIDFARPGREIQSFTDKHNGAYALTDQRLFMFDKSLSTWSTKDASKLRKITESGEKLNLYPVGQGLITDIFLIGLQSNYATAKYINSTLERDTP